MNQSELFTTEGIKRSLVLSGGGMRLSYQAGVLLALQQAGLKFFHVDATSGGSLNLSMLLSGLSVPEMIKRWDTLKMKDSLSLLSLQDYMDLPQLQALGDADGMRQKVFPHLGIDLKKIRQESGVIASYNILNYGEKQVEVFTQQQMDEDLLVAGMSLPGVFPPVRKNNAVYLDTAFIQDANLLEAVKRGAEEIWLVWGLGNTAEYKGGLLSIYVQMLETSANGALNNHIAQLKQINHEIENGVSRYGQEKPIRLHVIRPEIPLPLDPDLYLGKITNSILIDMGYADAKKYLQNHSEKGVELGKNITAMKPALPGIRYSEKLQGDIIFQDSSIFGDQFLRQSLTLSLTFHIHGLSQFIESTEHVGQLTGRLIFSNSAAEVILSNGEFSLFIKQSEDSRLIRYQADFRYKNQDYFFIGEKTLRDDPGFDLWRDFSTLHWRIYRKHNEAPSLIAEGALYLNVSSMATLMASVTATGSQGPMDAAQSISRFSQFLLGETAKVYF